MADKYTNCESVYQFAKELCKEKETGAYAKGYNNALRAIMSAARSEALPADDVRPVVRGRWVEHIEHDEETDCDVPYGFECSECGRWEQYKEPFCNCGAKMEVNDAAD